MAEVDVSKILKSVVEQDPNNGPGNIAGSFTTFITNTTNNFLNRAFRINYHIGAEALHNFKKFINDSPTIVTKINHSVNHVEARLAQKFLQEYCYASKKLDGFRILLLGASWNEYTELRTVYPNANVYPVFGFGNYRDVSRLNSARIAAANDNSNMAVELIKMIKQKKQVVGSYSAILNDATILNMNFDVILSFDATYYIHPEKLRNFQSRVGAFTTFFTMHMVAELFFLTNSNVDSIKNPIFNIEWKKLKENLCAEEKVAMTFRDNSPAYVSPAHILKAWSSGRFLEDFIWAPIYYNYGYGLFETSFVANKDLYLVQPFVSTADLLIRAFDVVEFLRYGSMKVFFIDRAKYKRALEYAINCLAIGEEINPMKLLTFLRGSQGNQHVGGVTISHAWDLLDESLIKILHFLIMDVSLCRREIQMLMRSLGAFFRIKSLADSISHWFHQMTNRFYRWIFSGTFNEWFQDFKDMKVEAELSWIIPKPKKLRQLSSPDLYDDIVSNILSFTKDDWDHYKDYRKNVDPNFRSDWWYNNSETKLQELMVFFSDVKVIHNFSPAPGGFSNTFKDKDWAIEEWLYVGEDGLTQDQTRLNLYNPIHTYGSESGDYETVDDIPPLEGGILCDASHCGEMNCEHCLHILERMIRLLARSPRIGVMVIKTNLVMTDKSLFVVPDRELSIVKPFSSSPYSTECYLVYRFSSLKFANFHLDRIIQTKILKRNWFYNKFLEVATPGYIRNCTQEEVDIVIRMTQLAFCEHWRDYFEYKRLHPKTKIELEEEDTYKPLPPSAPSDTESDDESSSDDKSEEASTLVETMEDGSSVWKGNKSGKYVAYGPHPVDGEFPKVPLPDKYKEWTCLKVMDDGIEIWHESNYNETKAYSVDSLGHGTEVPMPDWKPDKYNATYGSKSIPDLIPEGKQEVDPPIKESSSDVVKSSPILLKPDVPLKFTTKERNKFEGYLSRFQALSGAPLKNLRIADVGAGTSRFAKFCRQEKGIDCQSYDINGECDYNMDVTISYPAAMFDLIYLGMSWHHMWKFSPFRWVKPGGHMILREHILNPELTEKQIRDEHINLYQDDTVEDLLNVKNYKEYFTGDGFKFYKEMNSDKPHMYSHWVCYQNGLYYNDWKEKLFYPEHGILQSMPDHDCDHIVEMGVTVPVKKGAQNSNYHFVEHNEEGILAIHNVQRPGTKSYPFKHHLVVDTDRDGHCYFRCAFAALGRAPEEYEPVNWDPKITDDFILRMGYHIPTIYRKRVKGKLVYLITKWKSEFGYVLYDTTFEVGHCYYLAPHSMGLYSERPEFKDPLKFLMKSTPVDFSLDSDTFNELKTTMIADFEESPMMQSWMKSNSLTIDMLKRSFNVHRPGVQLRDVGFLDGAAGFGKTTILAMIAKELVKTSIAKLRETGFMVTRREARGEFVDALWGMLLALDTKFWMMRDNRESFRVAKFKTHQVFMARPSSELKVMLIDEGLTLPPYAYFWLAHANPNARMLIAGSTEQMQIDADHFPNWKDFTHVPQYMSTWMSTWKGDFMTRFDYTSRFGPTAVKFLKALGVKGSEKLTTCILRSTKITVVPFGKIDVQDGYYWMYQSKNNSWYDATLHSGMSTVAASQGVSRDKVALIWPKDTFTLNGEEYVALTRMKYELKIYAPEKHRLRLQNIVASLDNPRKFVGGTFKPLNEYTVDKSQLNRHYLEPTKPFKGTLDDDFAKVMAAPWKDGAIPTEDSLFEKSKIPLTSPVMLQPFGTADLITLDHAWNSYDSHKPSMTYISTEMKDCTIYGDVLSVKEFPIESLADTVFGKRHYSSSPIQSIHTLIGRLSTAVKLQKIANRKFNGLTKGAYDKFFNRLMVRFFAFYIDPIKYERLLDSDLTDTVLLETWNEFTRTIKWTEQQCENTVANRFRDMKGMLKRQMKVKSRDAPYENKGGQPIAAVSKDTVLCYALLFRFMVRLMKLSLYEQFKMAAGMSNQDIAEWLEEFSKKTTRIVMGDFKEFDASQNKHTQNLVKMCFSYFAPDLVTLNCYYEEIGNKTVFYYVVKVFWGASKPSGAPDTLDGNVVLVMVVTITIYPDGSIEWAIFLGDDSGVGIILLVLIFIMKHFDMLFPFPMKISTHPRVLEFCNHLFGYGTFVYNPYVLASKILQKDYAQVLKSREDWDDWRLSITVVFWTVRKHFLKVLDLCCDYFSTSYADMERLLVTIDNYCSMSYNEARCNLNLLHVVLSDEITVGGSFLKNKSSFSSPRSTYQSNQMDNQTIAMCKLADSNYKLQGIESEARGPAESVTWRTKVSVSGNGSFRIFTGEAKEKKASIKSAFGSLAKFLDSSESKVVSSPFKNDSEVVSLPVKVTTPKETACLDKFAHAIKALEHNDKEIVKQMEKMKEEIDRLQSLILKLMIKNNRNDYEDDLTREGVEKNPGPSKGFTSARNERHLSGYAKIEKMLLDAEKNLDYEWNDSPETLPNDPSSGLPVYRQFVDGFDSTESHLLLPTENNYQSCGTGYYSPWKLGSFRDVPNSRLRRRHDSGSHGFSRKVFTMVGSRFRYVVIHKRMLVKQNYAYQKDLTLDGDVEKNPGPTNEEIKAAKKLIRDVAKQKKKNNAKKKNTTTVKVEGPIKKGNNQVRKFKKVRLVAKPKQKVVVEKPRSGRTTIQGGKITKLVMGKTPLNYDKLPAHLKIALNICDPLTYKNFEGNKQMPRIGSSIATGDLTVSEKLPIDWDNTVTVPDMLTTNNAFAAGLRNFECGYIIYYQNKGAAGTGNTWNYQMYGCNDGVNIPPSTAFKRKTSSDPAPVPFIYGIPVSDFAPHGGMWFAGSVSAAPGQRWFYIPRTAQFQITLANDGDAEQSYNIDICKWTPENQIEFVAYETGSIDAGDSVTLNADDVFEDEGLGAYYSVMLSGSSNPAVTPKPREIKALKKIRTFVKHDPAKSSRSPKKFELGVTAGELEIAANILGNKSVFGHRAIKGFDVAPSTYEQTCVNGSAIWFTNLAAPAFTNGGSYGRQMQATEPWLSVVKHVQDYIGYEDTDLTAAKLGLDVFLKPDDISDFKLRKSHKLMGQYVVDSFWPIDSDDDWTCILLDVQPTPNQGIAQKGVFLCTATGEFTSNDPTREMVACRLSSLTMYKILDVIKHVPNVHTNGLHVKQIWDAIVKGTKDVQQVLNLAKPLIEMAM